MADQLDDWKEYLRLKLIDRRQRLCSSARLSVTYQTTGTLGLSATDVLIFS